MPDTPRVLAFINGVYPSTELDVIRPYQALARQGHITLTLRLSTQIDERDFEGVSVVVCHRLVEPRELAIVDLCTKRGIPLIYQTDDNFLLIPDSDPVGRFHRHPAHVWGMLQFIRNACQVQIYSPILGNLIEPYNHRIAFRKPYFELPFPPASITRDASKAEVRIVFATSRVFSDPTQALITNALVRLCKELGDKVAVYFMGPLPDSAELRQLANFRSVPFIAGYKAFMSEFLRLDFDIGLAPLVDDDFFNSKTNNKYREYGGCRIAGIYSDVPLYRHCVKERRTGLLVGNDEESWFQAIALLAKDKALRELIRGEAERDVLENYSFEAHCRDCLTQLHAVASSPPSAPNPTRYRNLLGKRLELGWERGPDISDERHMLERRIPDLLIPFDTQVLTKEVKPRKGKAAESGVPMVAFCETRTGWELVRSQKGARAPSLICLPQGLSRSCPGSHFHDKRALSFFADWRKNWYYELLEGPLLPLLAEAPETRLSGPLLRLMNEAGSLASRQARLTADAFSLFSRSWRWLFKKLRLRLR